MTKLFSKFRVSKRKLLIEAGGKQNILKILLFDEQNYSNPRFRSRRELIKYVDNQKLNYSVPIFDRRHILMSQDDFKKREINILEFDLVALQIKNGKKIYSSHL